MAWPLRLYDHWVKHDDWQPGDIWYDQNGRLLVVLPGNGLWSNDGRWEVTGEPPNITVNPSIKVLEPGGYHGYIRAGVLTDDIGGCGVGRISEPA